MNLGIIPEHCQCRRRGRNSRLITLTVEAGAIGGVPAGGLSFGASANAQAIVDEPYQFDFYDGAAGSGIPWRGAGRPPRDVNVAARRRVAGAGGFINISQAARNVCFVGTFTVGAQVDVGDGRLRIRRDGAVPKFVDEVGHVTFSGGACPCGRPVRYYITERCMLRLGDEGLELIEIAPGVDLERDVLARMGFLPQIAPDLREMDAAIFTDAPLGLGERSPLTLDERVDYRADDNLVFINFEGMTVNTLDEADLLASFLNRRLHELGCRVNLIVNYDNFELGRPAAPTTVVTAELDVPCFHEMSDVLADRIPGARKVTFPGVGHMINMEAPEAVNALLREVVLDRSRT